MLSYVFRYKFTILLAILIVLLSLVPSSSIPSSRIFNIPYLDKLIHFSMYASIGFVALMESRCRQKCLLPHSVLILAIFAMSAMIEILQATVVATRAAEWFDLLANFSGLIAGYVAYRILRNLRLFQFLKS
ncbi:MAG: VanZ family protein [Bacteroidota bacterium]